MTDNTKIVKSRSIFIIEHKHSEIAICKMLKKDFAGFKQEGVTLQPKNRAEQFNCQIKGS